MLASGSLAWDWVALAALSSFFLGLSLLLVMRGRAGLVTGAMISLGGLLACYSLAGSCGGKMAAAQYFGCLSMVLVLLQMCFWLFVVGGNSADEKGR